LLDTLSSLLQESTWLAPLFALVAGVFTSFTPCALSSIPLIIGYVGGTGSAETKGALGLSIVFVLGSAVTFTTLGVIASLMGNLIGASNQWWYLLLGVLMVLMALQTWEIYNFIPSTHLVARSRKRGYLGAFLAGILGGLFSTPCATPVLVVLLGIVAGQGRILWGAFLLLLYSLGHGTLALVAGTSVGVVRKLSQSQQYGRVSGILRGVMGTLILCIGLYMFYLGF